MPSPSESRAALQLVTGEAVQTSIALLAQLEGAPETRRLALLEQIPALVGYYSDGSAALAADLYEEERELSRPRRTFTAEVIVNDRTVKIRRAIAWAAEPLTEDDLDAASLRLAEVVQLETARPYRDTITGNRAKDPECVGWKRITAGGCPFCRMLASRGAVYRETTADFKSHPSCNCTCAPVFLGGIEGAPEPTYWQGLGTKRNLNARQKAQLREYLKQYEDD